MSISQLLVNTLEDLDAKTFRRFQWLLTKERPESALALRNRNRGA